MLKLFLGFVCVSFLICISGCNTVKGIGEGASAGMKKDWQSLEKADDKFQENYW